MPSTTSRKKSTKKKPVKYKKVWKILTKPGTLIRPGDEVKMNWSGKDWCESTCGGRKIGDVGTAEKYRRRIRVKVIALLLFAATLLFGAAPQISAQTSFSKGQVATWTPPTKHADGTPGVVIGGYELAIVVSSQNLNTANTVPLAVIAYGPDGYTGLTIDQLLNALPSGIFSIQVRAKNASNYWGAWSIPETRSYDTVPPEAPPKPTVR